MIDISLTNEYYTRAMRIRSFTAHLNKSIIILNHSSYDMIYSRVWHPQYFFYVEKCYDNINNIAVVLIIQILCIPQCVYKNV